MEVAVLVHGYNLVAAADFKAGFGLVAGFKNLPLISLFGLDYNPLNVVLFCHGVSHRADFDGDYVVLGDNNRNMLFGGSIHGVGDKLLICSPQQPPLHPNR